MASGEICQSGGKPAESNDFLLAIGREAITVTSDPSVGRGGAH